jgi:hypothetical protein
VAETSGFATDLPQSAYLTATIARAISAAQHRSHRYVTLEHLLLALLDDPDALALFEAARTDVVGLRAAAAETVTHNLATLYTPGTFDLRASYKVERVLQSASDDARRIGCVEMDGAFVAAALFHEIDSPAGALLKQHNFTFHAAMTWIYRNRGAPPAPRPAPQMPEPMAEQDAQPQRELAAEAGPQGEAEMLLEELSDDDLEEVAAADQASYPAEQPRRDAEAKPQPAPAGRPAPAARERPEPMPLPRQASQASEPPRPVSQRPAAPARPESAARAEREPTGRQEASGRPEPPLRPEPSARGGPARAEPSFRAEPRPERDLGTAVPARDLSSRPGWDREAGGASGSDQASAPRRGSDRRSLAESLQEAKVEPTFSPAPPQSDDGGAVPARRPPTSAPELEEMERSAQQAPDPQPNGAEGRMGHVVSARDPTAPILPPESRMRAPPQQHASVRDRSQAAGEAGRAGAPRAGRNGEEGASPARTDGSVPPLRRIDDMRLRPPRAPEPPPPPRTGQRKASAEKDSHARKKTPSAGAIFAGKLAENIPRKMRAFVAERVEVRVAREEGEALMTGFEGRAEPLRHDILVTQAMSVALRAPDGGFIIESLGPETQWIFNRPSYAEKESFGRWRWAVTPTETGQQRLQLVISSRTVDQDGLTGDTVLPDQVITVEVRSNYARSFARGFKWVTLLVLGGVITEAALYALRVMRVIE